MRSFQWKLRIATALLIALSTAACNRNRYRVIEREDRYLDEQGHEVSSPSSYYHDELHFVLKRGDTKVYAMCDITTVDKLDPNASCAMRVGQTFECLSGKKGDRALSDLRCRDSEGHNVYLYVNKEE